MQIQCPNCQEWTDSEAGVCAFCGTPFDTLNANSDTLNVQQSIAQNAPPQDFPPQNELAPLDIDYMLELMHQQKNYSELRKLEQTPYRKVISKGQIMTFREWQTKSYSENARAMIIVVILMLVLILGLLALMIVVK